MDQNNEDKYIFSKALLSFKIYENPKSRKLGLYENLQLQFRLNRQM